MQNLKLNLILFLFPLFLVAQNSVKVAVLDEYNNPVVRAIVIVYQGGNQIAFGSTNSLGVIEKSIANGTFQIKISKLGFVAQNMEVEILKNQDFSVKLETETNKLETVIIKSRPKIMRVKEDTISYNIKTVIDGTERKIDDVIKKLPGMNVDANGKVSYKGQEIDKVLIDGNEFFGNKHQMATQNIDANMVDGIDLLTNYQGFSTSKGSGGSIALNLKLKEGYRNKFVGDIEVSGGINNAFRTHNNLFRFSKTGNLAIISDYNTIAKTPITIDDYREMRIPTDTESNQNSVQSFELPTFMEPSNYNKRKDNGFVGINYTNIINKKSKITFSNLFNTTNTIQEFLRSQSNLDEDGGIAKFANLKNNNALLNNTQVKWEFNKSKKTFMSYNFGLTPNNDMEELTVFSPINTVDSNLKNNNLSFFQTYAANTIFFNKINYKFKIFNSYMMDSKVINLNGSDAFFDTNSTRLKQEIKIKTNIISIQNNFSFKIKKTIFSFKSLYLNNNSNSFIENSVLPFGTNSLKLDKNMFSTDFSILKFWNAKFSTTLGLKSSVSVIDFKQQKNLIPRNEPYITANYGISAAKKLSFSFAINHEFPDINHLQENNSIKDFQVLRTKSTIKFDQLIQKKEFGLDYFWINVYNQSLLFSKISYSIQDNAIANNIFYNANYSQNNFVITPKNNQLSVITQYDLKMNSIPLSLKSTLVFLQSKGFISFNNQLNAISNTNSSVKQQLFSNFKNSLLQFDFGYSYNRQKTSQGFNNFENTAYNYQIITTIKGKYKDQLKWDFGITRDFQDSGFSTNKLYFLNTNFDYQFTPKIKIILNGFNLLNLNTSSIIRTSIDENFFSESINKIMSGYIILGLNYSF